MKKLGFVSLVGAFLLLMMFPFVGYGQELGKWQHYPHVKPLPTADSLNYSFYDMDFFADGQGVAVGSRSVAWGDTACVIYEYDGTIWWTPVWPPPASIGKETLWRVKVLSNGMVLAVGTGGAAAYRDVDQYWRAIPKFTDGTLRAIHPLNSSEVLVGGGPGPVLFRLNWVNNTWTNRAVTLPIPAGYTGYILDITARTSNDLWIVCSEGVMFRSTNGGSTWSRFESGTNKHLLKIVFPDDSNGWIPGYEILLRTTNAGANWQVVPFPPSLDPPPDLMDAAFRSLNEGWFVGYFGDEEHFLYWNGERLQILPLPAGVSYLRTITFSPPKEGWAAGPRLYPHRAPLLRYQAPQPDLVVTEAGFTPISKDTTLISARIVNQGTRSADLAEVYFYYDLTPADTSDDPNLSPPIHNPPATVSNLAKGDSVVVSANWDTRNLVKGTVYPVYVAVRNTQPEESDTTNNWLRVMSTPVLVEELPEENLPRDFRLFQNFPNPFNSSTRIKFQLPKTCLVVLKVYNLLGQEQATLIEEDLGPGTYQVSWDAENQSSGFYFYRIQAGEFYATRRMVLLK